MTKKAKLYPYHFMVYTPKIDDLMDIEVETVNAENFEEALGIMQEFGTLMEPDHHATSLPRIMAHPPLLN